MRKILWVLMWLVLWYVGTNNLDPDFGWHIQMGNYIRKHGGVPMTDPFSYTMANFPFIDHEWLTNVGISLAYPKIGMAGLAAVAATAVMGVLWLGIPRNKWEWSDVVWILGYLVLLARAGVRPQVLDWLFVAILLRVVTEEKLWRKWKWGMVILELVWVNLHGGFPLGLAFLGCILAVKTITERKWRWSDWGVLAGMTAVTGLNPYGYRIWDEVVMQMTDTNLRSHIAEWQPFWAGMEMGFWLLTALMLSFFTKFKRQMPVWRWVIVGVTWIAGVSSLRHMPLFVVAALPVVTDSLAGFYKSLGGDREAMRRGRVFYTLLVLIIGLLWSYEAGVRVWKTAKGEWGLRYPEAAIEYLKQNKPAGNIFNAYHFGGYMIWKWPEQKVFIDGRMPSWRWPPFLGEQGKSPDSKYSDWAFMEYIEAGDKGGEEKVFERYGISTVLWSKEQKIERWRWEAEMDRWWRKIRNISDVVDLTGQLEGKGWVKVFEDDSAVIYSKP